MDKRFVKRLPNSAAGPSYKLTLPHQVVHRYMLHLVDADIELASHVTAKQVWHGSIAPRRNKERSEFTLQGWRLFAEAHKMQAGDQVAFELVGERRLVAQVIKQAEHPQVTHAPRPQLLACAGPKVAFQRKRKLDASPKSRSPRRMQKEACFREAEVPDLDVGLSQTPLEEIATLSEGGHWKDVPDVLSCGGSSGECTRFDFDFRCQSLEAGEVPEWGPEDPLLRLTPEPLPEVRPQPKFDSSISPSHPSSTGSPSRVSFLNDFQPSYAPSRNTSCMPPSFHDLLRDDFHNTDAAVPAHQHSTFVKPMGEPGTHLGVQLNDLSATIQTFQKQAQASKAQADRANHRAAVLRTRLDALQGGLHQHSRQALRAVVALDNCAASFPPDSQADVGAFLGQLKNSLSQLLVLSSSDGHPGKPADPTRTPQQHVEGFPSLHCYPF